MMQKILNPMKKIVNPGKKRMLLALGACLCACMLSACHGSKGLQTFKVPEEFD